MFDRFPNLKLVTTEAGCYWLSDLMWRWDIVYNREYGAAKLSGITAHISKIPSEYVDSNFWAGASNTKVREPNAATRSASTTSCGATIFHTPRERGRTQAVATRNALGHPLDETRRMLGESALDNVYSHLDRVALEELSRKIGPTPEDLGQTDDVDLGKWDELKAAGRPWLTHSSALPPAARGESTRVDCTTHSTIPGGRRT